MNSATGHRMPEPNLSRYLTPHVSSEGSSVFMGKRRITNLLTVLRTQTSAHRLRPLATMTSSHYSLSSTIPVGASSISMPRIHLGVYMTSGKETSSAVSHALSAGYKAIDSAEWYANEREVGSAILSHLKADSNLKREDVWFTTKLKTNNGYDATRNAIKKSVERSGLGYIDLYLLHSPYGGKAKREECWRAVVDAVEDGEVRVAGVSNFGVKHVSIPEREVQDR